MKNNPVKVRKTLITLIHDMGKSAWLYAKDPERDFSRNRKLPFEKLLALLISMGGGALTKELLDYFKCSPKTASSSAFIQQREKLLPEALEFLLHAFTESCAQEKRYRGYRLFAVDGSDVQISTNSADPDSYFTGSKAQSGYNLLHLDAVYDLCSRLYVDMFVHGKRTCGENAALVKMVDRASISGPAIFMADRNYEAFNSFAHIERKNCYYIIRIKDFNSSGIAAHAALPEQAQFDVTINYTLTRKHTNLVKALMRQNPEQYRFVPTSSTFDFLDLHENLFYPLSFRIVRFQIAEDAFEVVATNLPADQFPPEELKLLYNLRWGIETSFLHLKYTLALLNFHSRKTEHIVQEIFAKLIMYNFTEMVTAHVIIQSKSRKYAYQANFSAAVHICRQFLQFHVAPSSLTNLIAKLISPIRPGRCAPRVMAKGFHIRFSYRIA